MSTGLIGCVANGGPVNVTASYLGLNANVAITVATPASYDTTAFTAVTGAGIGGAAGTPDKWDAAKVYANDVAFRVAITHTLTTFSNPALVGTGTSSSLYFDGRYVDLVTLDNTTTYSGDQTFNLLLPAQNLASSTNTGELAAAAGSGYTSVWSWVRRRYAPTFTAVGDATAGVAVTFNAGQAASYKIAPFAAYGSQRAGVVADGGSTASINGENLSGSYGIAETPMSADTGASWTDGNWYDWLCFFEQWTGGNGNIWMGFTFWRRLIGSATYTRLGVRRAQDTGQVTAQNFAELSFTGQNYNQSRLTDLSYNVWGWAVWKESNQADPLAVLANEATLTPESCTLGAVSSQTVSTATFPITLGRFGKYVRPVIDGTEDATQEYALTRDIPDATYASNGGAAVAFVLPQTVTGLAAGLHTISYNIYNGNKTAHVNTGNQSVTI